MNWDKKQVQFYGVVIAILGILIGISGTIFIQQLLKIF